MDTVIVLTRLSEDRNGSSTVRPVILVPANNKIQLNAGPYFKELEIDTNSKRSASYARCVGKTTFLPNEHRFNTLT